MGWELELGGAQIVAIALAVISGALLLLLIFFYQNRQSHQETSRVTAAELAELRAITVKLEDAMGQLVRDMSGRLDSRMRALRELLREAGTTMEQLRQLEGRPQATSNGLVKQLPVSIRRDSAERAAMDQGTTNSIVAPSDGPADVASAEEVDLRAQRYSHVYSLADAGLNAAQISAETGMHCGEVELVLNLRRKKYRVDRGSRTESTRAVNSSEEALV